ncbi:MAG: hypothetical protein E7341_03145 [Clostridiales bacterium]|nr:hypothetical protein [Clostridiales bacterium]
MAIYFIGKTQRDIENLNIFAGSETIYGMNEDENYAMFSLLDEDKHKNIPEKKKQLALESLRFGMEKFKLLDNEAIFVFNDKELFADVMKQTKDEMLVTEKDIKIIENLIEFNNSNK